MSTDLSFLTRRIKRAPASATPVTTVIPRPVEAPASPIAITTTLVTLTSEDPAIRLTRYASGIGTLHIAAVSAAFIETPEGASYDLLRGPAPEFGNRPLAEITEPGVVAIGLRHLRQVRRIVTAGQDITVRTHAGVTVRVPGPTDLGIHVVAGHLELRRDTPSADLISTYALGAPA